MAGRKAHFIAQSDAKEMLTKSEADWIAAHRWLSCVQCADKPPQEATEGEAGVLLKRADAMSAWPKTKDKQRKKSRKNVGTCGGKRTTQSIRRP
jgi:hypothetical protein